VLDDVDAPPNSSDVTDSLGKPYVIGGVDGLPNNPVPGGLDGLPANPVPGDLVRLPINPVPGGEDGGPDISETSGNLITPDDPCEPGALVVNLCFALVVIFSDGLSIGFNGGLVAIVRAG
jgi:hypothetical protein